MCATKNVLISSSKKWLYLFVDFVNYTLIRSESFFLDFCTFTVTCFFFLIVTFSINLLQTWFVFAYSSVTFQRLRNGSDIFVVEPFFCEIRRKGRSIWFDMNWRGTYSKTKLLACSNFRSIIFSKSILLETYNMLWLKKSSKGCL